MELQCTDHRQIRNQPEAVRGPWWQEWEAVVLAMLVAGIYFVRLTAAPICGEESRWATSAREMIATGDWIVPRQQGKIFPERPPLGTWSMALVGLARGEVDLVAVRLPSVLAILASTLLIYAYARTWMSRLASFSSAAFFPTFGQVLGIGRFGESEALFTLFVAASLLIWHAGYLRGWPRALAWSLGYSFAALAALTKGPQAPVYFVGVTGVYLVFKRDWRWLFSLSHVAGASCFAAIVGSWFIPFAMSDIGKVDDIWAGLALERFSTHGLFTHLLMYPLETFGCMLPWSPLLFFLGRRDVRASLIANSPPVQFILVALIVTYPSVWLAAGARGRYFMPLYPCLALLMGLILDHCAAQAATWRGRPFLLHYLRGLAVMSVLSIAVVVLISVWPSEMFADARQPFAFLAVWVPLALGTAAVLVWASFSFQPRRLQAAVLAGATLLGVAYEGAVINLRVRAGNELGPAIANARQRLAESEQMVSFGGIYHRFAYTFKDPIRQDDWPLSAGDLSPDVTCFCYDRRPGDNDEWRMSGDGAKKTPGRLPFEWEKIAEIPCDPMNRNEAHRTVVIGRIVRPARLASPAVNPPVLR